MNFQRVVRGKRGAIFLKKEVANKQNLKLHNLKAGQNRGGGSRQPDQRGSLSRGGSSVLDETLLPWGHSIQKGGKLGIKKQKT